jgi:hypothetical protein
MYERTRGDVRETTEPLEVGPRRIHFVLDDVKSGSCYRLNVGASPRGIGIGLEMEMLHTLRVQCKAYMYRVL